MRSASVSRYASEGLQSSASGRIAGYPEITPKMEFCPDLRQTDRNPPVVATQIIQCLWRFQFSKWHLLMTFLTNVRTRNVRERLIM
jgi:hypothetical protein